MSPYPTPNAERSAAPTITAKDPTATLERARLARRAGVGALALGVLADMLLREGPIGIGVALWMLVFAGTTTVLIWRRAELTREQGLLLAAAVFFSSGIAWRDADDLQAFDFLATLAILLVLGATLRVPNTLHVFGARARDYVWAAFRGVADAIAGVFPLLFRDIEFGEAFPTTRRSNTAKLARAAAITIPLLIVFGTLFRSADPVFDKLLRIPSFDMDTVFSHVFITGFFTWIVAGWYRGSIVAEDARLGAPDGAPLALTSMELAVVLGALNVLFASFVAVQIGWLFGGEALVRSTTGLSLAEYARKGFFELAWVSVLVLPVLLGANACLPRGDASAAKRFRQLSLPLIGLLGAVMASAIGRMALYVKYYGLSTDRIDATAFMGWLAIVFVLFVLTVLRGRPTRFAGGMLVSGLAVLAALNVAAPDVIVARVNVGRVAPHDTVPDVDFKYLARLGGEAIPTVVDAVLATPHATQGTPAYVSEMKDRCTAAAMLLLSWSPGPSSSEDGNRRSWATWNYAEATARHAVHARKAELQRLACPQTSS